MSQYNTGTVAVTNGSATVTGASTLFSANVTVGDIFTVVGDNAFYTAASVDSDTQITLSANYAGSTGTGKAYTLVRDFTTNLGFPVPNQGDIETALVVKRAIEEIDSELNTAGIGGDGREWIDLADPPTYVSATQFKIANDKTASYHVNRRIRATDSATIYGGITASSFAAGETTVTVAWDSGGLTASLTAVAVGIASATAPSITGDAVVGGTMTGVSSTSPTIGAHVANKDYVDALVVSGIYWKQPVRAATTANITLSGAQTIDGVSALAGDRVLVKDQTTGSENGLYVVAAGAWPRSADADTDSDSEVVAGIAVWVNEGTANGDNGYVLTTDDPITLDTTALVFTQFSAGGGVSSVTATAPVTSSGGATPDIAITAATTGAAGSMSAADKSKLDGIEASATADQTAAEIKTAYESNADTNEFSDAEQTKLAGVASGAEVNPAIVSQADAEAGTATDERIWTAVRVKQAIDALSSGADSVARNNILLNAFRISINGGLSVQNMQDGMVDEFEDVTGVDAAGSTNDNYDAIGDFYTNTGGGTISQSAGTAFGDMTNNGGLVAAFDGINSDEGANAAASVGSVGDSYIGKNWGSSNAKTITAYTVYPAADFGFVGGAAANVTITLYGKNTTAPGSATDGTILHTTGSFADQNTAKVVTSGITATTAYQYHWIMIDGSADDQQWCAELEFTGSGLDDMVLQSNAFTAASTPSDARIVVFEEDVDTVTLNTDIVAYATRDAGQTFTTDSATDDKLDITAHGFANGDRITVSSATTLPAGLSEGVLYFVVNATANDFELSLTSGGAAVDITDNGTGAHSAFKWTQITLADEGDYVAGQQILAGSADISGLPGGTAMKYLIETLNDKELKLHGVALQWS